MHDSDPNTAKTCFVHVKSRSETLFFNPHLKKWASNDPLTLCFRSLCFWWGVYVCVCVSTAEAMGSCAILCLSLIDSTFPAEFINLSCKGWHLCRAKICQQKRKSSGFFPNWIQRQTCWASGLDTYQWRAVLKCLAMTVICLLWTAVYNAWDCDCHRTMTTPPQGKYQSVETPHRPTAYSPYGINTSLCIHSCAHPLSLSQLVQCSLAQAK